MSATVIRTTRLAPSVGWTAGAVAVTVPAAIVLLVVYFAVGGPFGTTLNDLANALVGVLSAVLAAQTARLGVPAAAVAAAGAGGAVMVVGSWLVITGRAGWVLAGLVSAVGAALVGAWLLALNVVVARNGVLPRGLTRLGSVSGAVMLLAARRSRGSRAQRHVGGPALVRDHRLRRLARPLPRIPRLGRLGGAPRRSASGDRVRPGAGPGRPG